MLEQIQQLPLPERMRHHHTERAVWRFREPLHLVMHRHPAFTDTLSMLETALAIVGQAQMMRRALNQSQAEQRFQRLEPPTDRWLTDAEPESSGRQIARLHDPDERLQQFEPIGTKPP
ncbi:hypothetical protein GCM10009038_19930 [Salinicola rhizosphaerae]|uniref:Uncharacterized protein n=1 Tax=Salinicola rhizosphaerae TaxID=1443141 RepID=A0ABQ3E0I6_9GAMM|nr:hypothetical protein GCM10009038_19930 [Salinicola rhizosphaerae]